MSLSPSEPRLNLIISNKQGQISQQKQIVCVRCVAFFREIQMGAFFTDGCMGADGCRYRWVHWCTRGCIFLLWSPETPCR